MPVNIALWIGGFVLLAIAIWRVRPPFARMTELDSLAENDKRYDSWRGGRSGSNGETTGADVMRSMLRRQVFIWLSVGALGIVLIVAGFAFR